MGQAAKKILIVDDDMAVRRLLATVLRSEYELAEAESGEEALEKLPLFAPDLVLLDIMLPGIDGYETCRRIKSSPVGGQAQVVMVSAKSSRQEQIEAYQVGADDYLVKPVDVIELRSRVQLHFQLQHAMANVRSVKGELESHSSEIRRLSEERTREILATQDVAVFTLAKVAESRDQEAGGHLVRMRAYSQCLGEQLQREGPYAEQIDNRFLSDLYRSSPLHDLGKVGISDAVLLKPGPLTPDEFKAIERHTIIGANILEEAVMHSPGGNFLAMAAAIARYHHERFDGTGYPAGLVAEEIPLPARIVAVADVYDALTSARPYKTAYDPLDAEEMVESESGRHFDPVVVDAFRSQFDELLRVGREYGSRSPTVVGAMAFREYDYDFAEQLNAHA